MRALILATTVLFASSAFAVELRYREGDLIGYPALFDDSGSRIGGGEFHQHATGKTLSVSSTYRFDDGRKVEEKAEFDTQPQLIQKKWSFDERRGEVLLRHYEVDFATGVAQGEKHEGSKVKQFNEHLKVDLGRAFAGLGFVFATKNLSKELKAGTVRLQAVAFTPKPRTVDVDLHYNGDETLTSGSNSVTAQRITIEPVIPRIARAFVHPKPATMFFADRNPPQLLRTEATLAEPEEALVQINLFGSSSRIGRRPASR